MVAFSVKINLFWTHFKHHVRRVPLNLQALLFAKLGGERRRPQNKMEKPMGEVAKQDGEAILEQKNSEEFYQVGSRIMQK